MFDRRIKHMKKIIKTILLRSLLFAIIATFLILIRKYTCVPITDIMIGGLAGMLCLEFVD